MPDKYFTITGNIADVITKENKQREAKKVNDNADSSKNTNLKETQHEIIVKILDKFPKMILEINNEHVLNAKVKVVLDVALYREKKMMLEKGNPGNLVVSLYKMFEKALKPNLSYFSTGKTKKNNDNNLAKKDALLIYAVKSRLWDIALKYVDEDKNQITPATLKESFKLSVEYFSNIEREKEFTDNKTKSGENDLEVGNFIVKLALSYHEILVKEVDEKLQMYILKLFQKHKELQLEDCTVKNIFAGKFPEENKHVK